MGSKFVVAFVATVAMGLGSLAGTAGAAAGDIESVELSLLGQSSLPSRGHDGQTKPRGQNGDVAISGTTAFVAGGAGFHGAQSSPGRICTDYGGVKVVDISDPSDPSVITQIDVEDTKGVLTAPLGNPRRGLKLQNVSSSVSTIDVIEHPVAGMTILALATQRCEQSFFNGARIEFWNVSDPATPTRVGVFDPATLINPKCDPGPPVTCPPGTSPITGQWGIFEEVRMFTRNNGPGGSLKVYALATTPFSIGNSHDASFAGDFRLLDITDPASATQIGTFPPGNIGQNSNNGCRTFQAGRAVAPSPDGSRAILSWYDGAQPAGSPINPTGLPGPNSAALFNLDLDNLPTRTSSDLSVPITFTPAPPMWGYPFAAAGGETAAGLVEGNAADVQPFLGPAGELLTWVSEEDLDPAVTRAIVDGPPEADYTGRACETLFASKLHQRPGQALTDAIAFVGRGCPASRIAMSNNRVADPYLEDPAGRIAVIDSGGSLFDGCSAGAKIKRAVAAGATGVVFSLGADALNLVIPGPDGGIPAVPTVGMQLTGFDRMAGLVPNRVLTGTAFPPTWTRTSDGAVVVKPMSTSVSGATNAGPIEITSFNHGLATGDRVAIDGVLGNTNANGNWTVTVTSVSKFTLDGSTGNGAYAGGGVVYACPPGEVTCSVPETRADGSRFRSIASAADRVAGAQVNAVPVVTTEYAAAGATSLTVAPLSGPIAKGATVRFADARVVLSAAAAAAATTLAVNKLAQPISAGSRGSVAFRVTPGATYRAGSLVEIEQIAGGAFKTAVVWYDQAGAEVGTEELTPAGGLTAVSGRTLHAKTVTAPVGAARGSVRFGWSGAAAEGTAYVDSFFARPDLELTLRDEQGAWGAQRLIDFSQSPPKEIASFQSPGSKLWPPPNNGIYAPEQARMLGNDLAFSAWMSDGLRVLDVKAPTQPRLVGSFVPPDVADPSDEAGAGPTDRIGASGQLMRGKSWPDRALVTAVDVVSTGTDEALVALSDINAGLYLVRAKINREVASESPADTGTTDATTTPATTQPGGTTPTTPAACAAMSLRRRDADRRRYRIVPRVRTFCAGAFSASASVRARVGRRVKTLRLRSVVRRTRSGDRSIAVDVRRSRSAMRELRRKRRLTVTFRLRFKPRATVQNPWPKTQKRTFRVVVRLPRR